MSEDCQSKAFENASQILRAMSNDCRLRVLYFLMEGEKNVGELTNHIDVSQSALSQHLAKLRSQNLVCTRRDAQMIYYSLADDRVQYMLGQLANIFDLQMSTRLTETIHFSGLNNSDMDQSVARH